MAVLTWLGVPGDAEQWSVLGFTVSGGIAVVGRVACEWIRPPHGIRRARIRPGRSRRRDRLPNRLPSLPSIRTRVARRHVVYTVADLTKLFARCRRARRGAATTFQARGESGPEMAFYRVGDAFIEVVASGRPASLMACVHVSGSGRVCRRRA